MKSTVIAILILLAGISVDGQVVHEVFDGESIQAAISSASVGDTIKINEGLYEGSLTVDKKLHFIGAGNRDSIRIVAAGTGIYFNTGSNGSSVVGVSVTSSGGNGIYLHHVGPTNAYLFLNNKISDCAGTGILSGNYFNNNNNFPTIYLIRNLITGNRIGVNANENPYLVSAENMISYNDSIGIDLLEGLSAADSIINNGNGDGFGIKLVEGGNVTGSAIIDNNGNGVWISDPTECLVQANKISGNTGNGIYTHGGGDMQWKIINNLVILNGKNGVYFTYDQNFGHVSISQLSNNIIANNGENGILFDETYFSGGTEGNTGDLLVNNNIISGNSLAGIDRVITGETWVVEDVNLLYNNVYNNAAGNYLNGFAGGTGSISADPAFTDAGSGDFSLQPGSPSINAGQPSAAWLDIDLTRNDQGIYGGSFKFDQYYGNPLTARLLKLKLSNRFVRPGETITIEATGLVR